MEYGLHNPRANVVARCPFEPCGYSSWEGENSRRYRNRPWLHCRSQICTQNGLVSFALMLQSTGLSEPHQEVTQPTASIIFHIPNFLSSFFPSAVFRTCIKNPPIITCYQKPQLLKKNCMNHASLCSTGLHQLSKSPRMAERSLWLFVPKCSTHPASDVPQIDHKITVSNVILCVLWIMN